MKLNLFDYSKNRKWYINLIFCLISFIGLLIIPSILFIFLKMFIKDENVSDIIANLLFILLLYLMYYKDLNKEFKTFKDNFKSNVKVAFKYYVLGMMGMVFFNLIIVTLLNDISSNETQVRDMLFNNTIYTLLTIAIIAPLSEEIIFSEAIRIISIKTINKALFSIFIAAKKLPFCCHQPTTPTSTSSKKVLNFSISLKEYFGCFAMIKII